MGNNLSDNKKYLIGGAIATVAAVTTLYLCKKDKNNT